MGEAFESHVAFQRLLFKQWPDELKELALSSSRMIETRSSLTKQLKNLESDQLRKLCCDQLKLDQMMTPILTLCRGITFN